MSYEKIQLENLPDGQIAVQLDSGEIIAITLASSRCEVTHNLQLQLSGNQVDSEGVQRVDGNGLLIQSAYSHKTNDTELANLGGVNELVKQCVNVLLGETTALLLSDDVLAHASIRRAIAAVQEMDSLSLDGALAI
jgi:hypothetical protein